MKNLMKIATLVAFALAGGFSTSAHAIGKIATAQCVTKCTKSACGSDQDVWNACFDACKTRLWTIRNCISAAGKAPVPGNKNGFISECQQRAITSLQNDSKPLSCEVLCNRDYCGSAKINWDKCYYGCRENPTSIINCRKAASAAKTPSGDPFIDDCQKASNAG